MKSAYISLYDKSEILPLAKTLKSLGYEIYSHGSTLNFLAENEIDIIKVESEIHPNIEIIKLFAGKKKGIIKPEIIIADIPHNFEDDTYNILLILTAIKKGIGKAKDKKDIDKLNSHLKLFGEISEDINKELISNALNRISYILATQRYNIFPYINTNDDVINIPLKKIFKIKYGENPHQSCFIYSSPIKNDFNLDDINIINGELNLNHYLDIKKAVEVLNSVNEPLAMAIKHANICSISYGDTPIKALKKITEYGYDIKRSYAFNRNIDIDLIYELEKYQPESIIALSFSQLAIDYIKKNNDKIKILTYNSKTITPPSQKEIINLGADFAIEDKDILDETQRINFITGKNIMENIKDIKLALLISKNLKTYSSVIVSDGRMLSFSQGEDTSSSAIRSSIYKIKSKNMIKLNEKDMILAVSGSLDEGSLNETFKLPVKLIIQGTKDINEGIIKIIKDKQIAFAITQKRHFKH